MSSQMCTKQDVQKAGATIVINAECQIGPVKTSSRTVVSGDFNSSYTVEVTTKAEGLPAAAKSMSGTRTIQARWMSACKPGQRPGDMVLPDGRTINILDLKQGIGAKAPAKQPPK